MSKDISPASDITAVEPDPLVLVEVIEDHTQIGGHIKAKGHQEEMLLSKARTPELIGHIRIIGTR